MLTVHLPEAKSPAGHDTVYRQVVHLPNPLANQAERFYPCQNADCVEMFLTSTFCLLLFNYGNGWGCGLSCSNNNGCFLNPSFIGTVSTLSSPLTRVR